MRNFIFLVLCASCVTVSDTISPTVSMLNVTRYDYADGGTGAGTLGSTCSGVSIVSDGTNSLVLSAGHCTEQQHPNDVVPVETEYAIKTFDGSTMCNLVLIARSETKDLALFAADCKLPVAEIDMTALNVGDSVRVVGYPAGINVPIVTEGYFSGIDTDEQLVLSAAIAGGSSGGPVYHNGKLVGIVVAVNYSFHHISFAEPISGLGELLGRVK